VLDLGRVDPGALHRVADGVTAQLLGLGVVEGPAIGPADRRAGGGDDDGFAHGKSGSLPRGAWLEDAGGGRDARRGRSRLAGASSYRRAGAPGKRARSIAGNRRPRNVLERRHSRHICGGMDGTPGGASRSLPSSACKTAFGAYWATGFSERG